MFDNFAKDKLAQNSLSQLTFVSTLNLEDAVQLLSDLADDKHPIVLTDVSPDKILFEMDYLYQDSSLAKVTGSLQRWNGTETKLDARGSIKRLDNAKNTDVASFVILAIGLIIFSIVVQNLWFIPIFGILGLGIYAAAKLFETDDATVVLFRERDYLFQRLIDSFKAVSELEAV